MHYPAFIFIDVLADFFKEGSLAEAKHRLVAAINELAAAARAQAYPVIWVRQEYRHDLADAPLGDRDRNRRITIEGTEGCRLLQSLVTAPSDHAIVKKRYSAFFGTTLDQLLATIKPSHLIIGGINSHACVRSTAVDAYQRDYRIILASDCIASYDPEYHRESMRYLAQSIGTVMTNEDIIRAVAMNRGIKITPDGSTWRSTVGG